MDKIKKDNRFRDYLIIRKNINPGNINLECMHPFLLVI
jgi:hypothetical protein